MADNKTEKEQRGFGRKMTMGDKVKMALYVILILLFALWMGSWIPFIFIPFVIDLYWMHFIKWDWWKDIKNGFLRGVMSWVDAIVFAICAVWILQNFFFQNFQIPTTSLEKTMLAGDYLLVSKYHYGPRVPMTPLSLPLFQHTISFGNTRLGKSYIENPQVNYRRMPGLEKISRGDIVVFNYPNGDTVCTNCENPDYYQLCRAYGRDKVWSDKSLGEIVTRPVDRRENYVKRCIGLPGETLQIIDRQVMIDGKPMKNPRYLQHFYLVLAKSAPIPDRFWSKLGIYTHGSADGAMSRDVFPLTGNSNIYQTLGIEPDSITGRYNPLYQVNMTVEMKEELEKSGRVEWVKEMPEQYETMPGEVYPQDVLSDWTANNFGPLWIPKRGSSIELTDANVKLYGRCITTYEPNQLTGDGQGNKLVRLGKDQYELNGKEAKQFTFGYDYYWMMGDNRDNSLDSRFWGFVPEDHIVGTPLFVWFSVNKETGDLRSDRWFKRVKTIGED